MAKPLKKICNIILTIIVTAAVILALLFVGVRLFGFKVYTVLLGSMEPTFHAGSVVYVKPVNYTELKEGDPITFMLDEKNIATHRIVSVIPDTKDASVIRFQTKGDANDTVDSGLVHYRNVIGVPVFSIPYLGYVANYIQNPPGLYISIAFGVILLLLVFLPDLIGGGRKKDKKSEQDDEEAEDLNKENEPFKDDIDEGKLVKAKKRTSKRAKKAADDLTAVDKFSDEEIDTFAQKPGEKKEEELTEMDILNAELEEILGKRN